MGCFEGVRLMVGFKLASIMDGVSNEDIARYHALRLEAEAEGLAAYVARQASKLAKTAAARRRKSVMGALEEFGSSFISSFRPVWATDLRLDEIEIAFFIDGMLADGGFSVLSGTPGSLKTFAAIDLACHVQAGMDWHGRKVRQRPVIYVAAERGEEVKKRVIAWKQKHGITDLDMLITPKQVDFFGKWADTLDIADTMRVIQYFFQAKGGLVIIDTMAMSLGDGDINSNQDVKKFTDSCKDIMSKTGAHVMVVHHVSDKGESGKPMGATALSGAVDASFVIKEKADDVRELKCIKANNIETGVYTHFKPTEVVVGRSRDGVDVKTLVVDQCEEGKTRAKKLLDNADSRDGHVLAAIMATVDSNNHVPLGNARTRYILNNPLPEDATAEDKKRLDNRFDAGIRSLLKALKIKKEGTSLVLT
ncbi:AAA domain-containing protein [Rhizobium mongolense USDA 1844]|uniref:AAA domain-containing protein n=1 Tax=Rhizobium mongolense USDA 1844 TaxID=1079460 RepID=A0A559SNL4_9HYPH|nr:AAA domain-containing protein [Rhizobium mongolense USDA 1844]